MADDSPTERILDLYEELKGVTFQGVYQGVEEKNTAIGVSVKYHLIRVLSTHVKAKMESILACDDEDCVWKGISNGHTFWAHKLDGPIPDGETSFELYSISHYQFTGNDSLKWQEKEYEKAINIHLRTVTSS